jgi:hypothetical protein
MERIRRIGMDLILCVGWFCDTMGERIGRIQTDFSVVRLLGIREKIPTE